MPDAPVGPEVLAAGRAGLRSTVADAVLAVPGVLRLEPTLNTSGPRLLLERNPYDGVHVIVRAGVVDVDVNVATSTSHQARAVAHRVRAGVAAVLVARGYASGPVAVSVLAIEPPDGGG